jgi:hypothetical protein
MATESGFEAPKLLGGQVPTLAEKEPRRAAKGFSRKVAKDRHLAS